MSLKSRIYEEGTSSWVHSTNVKSIFDIFKGELAAIIPMFVILMLSYKSNSSLGVIFIESRHVEIVNKVDELIFTDRSISLTCFLLKLLLKDCLKQS